jgi:hypothetical protein
MMKMELVSKMLDLINPLTRLSANETFIEICTYFELYKVTLCSPCILYFKMGEEFSVVLTDVSDL